MTLQIEKCNIKVKLFNLIFFNMETLKIINSKVSFDITGELFTLEHILRILLKEPYLFIYISSPYKPKENEGHVVTVECLQSQHSKIQDIMKDYISI